MTDEEACAAALDRHFDEADSYTGDEQRAFDGGFAAGLEHARTWRALTSDPASWPEEGQEVATLSRSSLLGAHRWYGEVDERLVDEKFTTHWAPLPPLPPPPEQEKDG